MFSVLLGLINTSREEGDTGNATGYRCGPSLPQFP